MLELLYEPPGLPALALTPALRERYPGALGFERPRVVANFVTTLDGVVAIPSVAGSNRLIAGASEADRFVMALLRACADAILVGSGTLRASLRSRWTAEAAYPEAADAFAELRRDLGLPPLPELAVVTGSGMLDPGHPAFERGALALTTDGGARALAGRLPASTEVVSLGDGPAVELGSALALLRERGLELVLVEAGPHVLGSLLADRLADELFLTVSPVLAGRLEGETRLGLVEALALLPDAHVAGTLLGVRRSEAHLFLRYALEYGPGREP
jgi:riboflavin biosynthesis pyrimidine reductase